MNLSSRIFLITAGMLTGFTILLQAQLPLLFILLVSEFGAIVCLAGLWFLWQEKSAGKPVTYLLPAAALFVLFGVRFAISGLQHWPQSLS